MFRNKRSIFNPNDGQPAVVDATQVLDSPLRRGPPIGPTPTFPTELILDIISHNPSSKPSARRTTLLPYALIDRSWAHAVLPLLNAIPVLSRHNWRDYLALRSKEELEQVTEIIYRTGVVKESASQSAPVRKEEDEFPAALLGGCPNLRTIELVLFEGRSKHIMVQSLWGRAGITSIHITNITPSTDTVLRNVPRRPKSFPSLHSLTFTGIGDWNAPYPAVFSSTLKVIGPACPNLSNIEFQDIPHACQDTNIMVQALYDTSSLQSFTLPALLRHSSGDPLQDSEIHGFILRALRRFPNLTVIAITPEYFNIECFWRPVSLPSNIRVVRVFQPAAGEEEEDWRYFLKATKASMGLQKCFLPKSWDTEDARDWAVERRVEVVFE